MAAILNRGDCLGYAVNYCAETENGKRGKENGIYRVFLP